MGEGNEEGSELEGQRKETAANVNVNVCGWARVRGRRWKEELGEGSELRGKGWRYQRSSSTWLPLRPVVFVVDVASVVAQSNKGACRVRRWERRVRETKTGAS
jgi:hypothetical protein